MSATQGGLGFLADPKDAAVVNEEPGSHQIVGDGGNGCGGIGAQHERLASHSAHSLRPMPPSWRESARSC
jgi:hypothetical protein